MSQTRLTFDQRLGRAVAAFWAGRAKSVAKQQASGRSTEGNRGAVTGGKTLDSFRDMIAEVARRTGPKGTRVHRNKTMVILPGYFRPTKQWDLLIEHSGRLLAAFELKSLCGPSFGNNANNRCEEALGSACDLRKAQSEGMLGAGAAPFVGYFILVEDAEGSRRAVSSPSPHFPTDVGFKNASYQHRMRLMCERMVQQQLYSCAAVLTTPTQSVSGCYAILSDQTSYRQLVTRLASHLTTEAELTAGDGLVEENQTAFGSAHHRAWDDFDPDGDEEPSLPLNLGG